MCGICGIIDFDSKKRGQEYPLTLMMDSMKHRGPDDKGIFIEDNIGLGFVRLSIIDLSSGGHQPMFSHDQRFVIVFNGEIYNYLEIKEELIQKGYKFTTKSDTEVLLVSYIEWGEKCLNKFNGMWAFVIYDRYEKEIFCSRDRFGVKPFYYCIEDNRLIIASEIPPILKIIQNTQADYQAIYDYLVFNRTDQSDSTFFNNVKKLQHGCILKLNSAKYDGVVIKKWYDLRNNIKEPFSSPDEFRQMFQSSIELRLRSDVPVGVCLSGGLDSSSIVSVLLNQLRKIDLNTFSAVYNTGDKNNESAFITEYLNSVKNMFFTTPTSDTLLNDLSTFIRAHGEPVPSTGPYAQYKVMELANRKVTVTLDGQGADEMLAGYHYFFGIYLKELLLRLRLHRFLSESWQYFRNHKSFYAFVTFLFFLLPSKLKNKTRAINREYLRSEFIKKYSVTSKISEGLYATKTLHESLIDHFEYKMEHLLKWEDRNSMWFSIEARVPFLDYRLVESTLSLPNEKIIWKGMTKQILRESMKEILPEKIRTRKDKIGFDTPQEKWFKEERFKELIFNILDSDSFGRRNLIDKDICKKLYHDHLSGKTDLSKDIWKWINLELWFREFIDKKVSS